MTSMLPQSRSSDPITKSSELVAFTRAEELAERYAGFPSDDAPILERLGRIAALVPLALEIVDEARSTIERLNNENEDLIVENSRLREQLSNDV